MGVIVAVVNQKGGCAKTTTAIHLSLALTSRDYRVLVIDLDPQRNASTGLGAPLDADRPSLSEALAHTPLTGVGPGLEDTLVSVRTGLDLVPGDVGLAGLEPRLAAVPGREERLAEHLAAIAGGWDVVLIDCPPSLGLLTINALVAAREALVPIPPAPFALDGAARLEQLLESVRELTGHSVAVRYLPTIVPPRDAYAKRVLAELRERCPGRVMGPGIRRSILFARAASEGLGLGELAPRSAAWRDYRWVAERLAVEWEDAHELLRPRFAGLRATAGGVFFTHPDLAPEQVALAGQFNDWQPDRGVVLRKNGEGAWEKFLATPAGRFEYKFVKRGEWLTDPSNPRHVFNPHGTENSVIEVLQVSRPEPRHAREDAHA